MRTEEGELAAQNVDRAHARVDQVVADLVIGMAARRLDAANGVTVLGMAGEEARDAGLSNLTRKLAVKFRDVARHAERLLQFAARLLEALAEPRLELLGGRVPEAGLLFALVVVPAERPGVVATDELAQLGDAHAAIDGEEAELFACHLIGEIVDQRAVRLDQKRDQKFLAIEAEMVFG